MSLYQQILASLSSAPTQNNRLLELHTPLGANVLVAERADIEEAIGPNIGAQKTQSDGSFDGSVIGCSIVVHALAADGHIELKSLIGQPALLNLLTAQSRTALRPFHGHITQAALMGSDGGLARYRLVIEPWLSFLAHRTDACVFQAKTVIQIIEEVFADYQSQGKLMPAWRWDLADASVYPERSLSIQYQETDLAFVQRLLIEEGLFCWIEHTGNSADASLGAHTLVIADHNNAFQSGAQAKVRFTQATTVGGSSLFKSDPQDSLTNWSRSSAVQTASVELASLDYRAVSLRPQSQSADARFIGDADSAQSLPDLSLIDIPGVYAFEDSAQGQRLALRQMQALDAQREQVQAQGNLRTAAPGTTFSLLDHAEHDGSDDERDRFIILSAQHRARSNLSADHQAQVNSLLGAIDAINTKRGGVKAEVQTADQTTPSTRNNRNHSKAPIYQCRIQAQRAAVPVRLGGVDKSGLPDVRLHPRPTLHGVQTAVVVGISGQPIHTDRDQRIKVQFHWQRGANASHRLNHPADDNAPASDASGTWVRVAQTVAGANWGAVFSPRLGQEVLVQFIAGDVDRPVVVGVVYNGQGSLDAQGNQVSGGAATATGNAPAWFPGGTIQNKKQGKLQGHQHNAVLSGYKSQELSASQTGMAGHNQLVFDDSAGAGRIELSSTSSATRLQLGHLLHQSDNQRLQPRGHGLDLSSAAWGALRAGSGLLLSAHSKTGSQSGTRSLDSREAQTQVEQSQQLLHTLAESAQQHNAKLTSPQAEPDVIGAKKPDKAKQLAVEQAMYASVDSLAATDQRSAAAQNSGDSTDTTGGGAGSITAWSRPDLVLAAPGGIATFTPASQVMSAGNTLSLVAGQDLQHIAQSNFAAAIKSGLVFYTYGKATNTSKPNLETGIALHAASGNVNTQSQSAATRLTADKAVQVSSTSGMVRITAPKHILLTAAGAAIDIQPGRITIKGPGKMDFKASMKVLTSPGSDSQSLQLKGPSKLKGCAKSLQDAATSGAAV
jgi:type VI secretion system secreted protein VgrG